jgi:hypothetical protein
MRKTVTITTKLNPQPAKFHLEAAKAERFAAKIIADGGTAVIGPLNLGSETIAMLEQAGLIPAVVR